MQSPSKSRDIVLSLLQTLQEGEESFAKSGSGHFPAHPGACKSAICDGEEALRRLRQKYLFVGNTLRDGLLSLRRPDGVSQSYVAAAARVVLEILGLRDDTRHNPEG